MCGNAWKRAGHEGGNERGAGIASRKGNAEEIAAKGLEIDLIWDAYDSDRLDEWLRQDGAEMIALKALDDSGNAMYRIGDIAGIGKSRIAVVIPCFRVRRHIMSVLEAIGEEVDEIFVVDDKCPEGTGAMVRESSGDPRVKVYEMQDNLGVGGATMFGFQRAMESQVDIIVKVDGDGQMDPALIPEFVLPIVAGEADYTKGNRFFDLEQIGAMPRVRLFGNAVLSFMSKLSTGYWDVFDPTNGYLAIHADVVRHLPFEKISKRYYFETDVLFRLNTLRAVVVDIPMDAKYGEEISNLKISGVIGEFLFKHARNFMKRLFYNYYLRDLSLASVELPLGAALMAFGLLYGLYHWYESAQRGVATPAGTVMLAALPVLMGLQFIIAFLSYDIAMVPRNPKHSKYRRRGA